MLNMIMAARLFAEKAHDGQERKYTGDPYIVHPIEVAQIVQGYVPDATDEMVAAALLHDVVEDCDVTLDQIENTFGKTVAQYVDDLTEREVEGNRAVRKEAERVRFSEVCSQSKAIKMADLISNTSSIVEHDPGFAKVYLAEKGALLPVLRDGSEVLYQKAAVQLLEAHGKLQIKELTHGI